MKHYEVVVIGAGPAGLSAAIEARTRGLQVLIIDSNLTAGGQLFKQIHKFFGSNIHKAGMRGIDIGQQLLHTSADLGIEVWLNSVVIGIQNDRILMIRRGDRGMNETEIIQAEGIVIATGASEKAISFPGWTFPGVMGAGAIQTMINVSRVLPGKNVLMIGSGNVGLIVSYQLLQAGAKVVGIVEALPRINGYLVHSSKVIRAGVPLYTSHTIISAETGSDQRVCRATIAQVDYQWKVVRGSEKLIDCDTIAIAVGLKPLVGFASMCGCDLYFDKDQGGIVPCHNSNMETSVEGVYVAGDVTGVEEANTAMEEGRLAGAALAEKLGHFPDADSYKSEIWERLTGLRAGSHGDVRRCAKARQIERYARQKGRLKYV